MTKKEVKAMRLTNEPVLFNREAALLAFKSAAIKKGGARAASSELTKGILECFELAKKEGAKTLYPNQVREMYNAAKKANVNSHNMSTRIWTMCKGANPSLKRNADGTYELAK